MASNSFTLDDIRAAAEKKYGHTEIQGVVLLNPLRLSKDARDNLMALQDKLGEDGADQEALLKECIVTVARDRYAAEALVNQPEIDLAMLVTIFEFYSKETDAGEA